MEALMKTASRNLATIILLAASVLNAQSKDDEAAVHQVPQAFAAAWAKHDGHRLAQIMSPDIDFVNVSAEFLHGRHDFEVFHTRLLSTQFKDSILTPINTTIRFLTSDLALLHWNWRIDNDRNADMTARKPRFGLFTMVVQKQNGQWLVTAAQNTNWTSPPNPDPVMIGLKHQIEFPPEAYKP
jgi:uncharacterized protein (TIGR02246 family)